MAGESKGWISVYRSIQDNILWEDKPFSKGQAWIDLLLLANHKEGKTLIDGNVVDVKRGEFITSLRKLCDRWGWSNTKLKRFLNVCQDEQMLSYKSDTKKTVITIVNYSVYQGVEKQKNDAETSQKHHRNDTETSQKHTNNNDNNVNNENNDNKRESTYSTESLDLIKYYSEMLPGQNIGQHMATLNIWIEMYGYEWTKEAIQKCVSNKSRFIKSYVEVILKNWARDGKEESYGANTTSTTKNDEGPKYDFSCFE